MNTLSQHQAIIQTDILTDLPDRGFIKCSGEDAKKFLQGQLTCDVQHINQQQSCLGAYCDHKGRVLSIFQLFHVDNDFYLNLPKNVLEHTLKELQKFSAFSKVTIEDFSNQFKCVGIAGPRTTELLRAQLSSIPKNINDVTLQDNLIVTRIYGKQPRYVIFNQLLDKSIETSRESFDTLRQTLTQQTIMVDLEAWGLLDIINGIPEIYPETIGLFTPHVLNLQKLDGISLNKGCYRGQEIIARMHYLGKQKQHMYFSKLEASHQLPKPGDELMDDSKRVIGNIVRTCYSEHRDENTLYLLVTIKEQAKETGQVYFHDVKLEFDSFDS